MVKLPHATTHTRGSGGRVCGAAPRIKEERGAKPPSKQAVEDHRGVLARLLCTSELRGRKSIFLLCCYSATKGVLPNETFNKRSPPSHREVIACQLPKSHLSFGTSGPSPSRVSHAPPDSPRPAAHPTRTTPGTHPRHSSGGAYTPGRSSVAVERPSAVAISSATARCAATESFCTAKERHERAAHVVWSYSLRKPPRSQATQTKGHRVVRRFYQTGTFISGFN